MDNRDYAVFYDDEDEIEKLSIWCSKEEALKIHKNIDFQTVILKRVNLDD
tara:strand:- start:51107 stop:51256 length:150 start_codon:yes stop_codon:yes gene_type:complete